MISLDSLEDVIGKEIMPGDHMYYESNPGHYFSVGKSAISCIRACMSLANSDRQVNSVLDFASGSGRVTRWLIAEFPSAIVTASDLRQDSLEFLSRKLKVEVVPSHIDFSSIKFDGNFDLIWCGSLATHISEDRTRRLIECVGSWLSDNGIAVVTFHGRKVRRRLMEHGQRYTSSENANSIVRMMDAKLYGYQNYPGRDTSGISVCDPVWMINAVRENGFRIVALSEAAWDNHQDIIAFSRDGGF